MNYEDLTDEQRARAAECRTPEELLALAKEEGIDIPDEDLEKIAGGLTWGKSRPFPPCERCGSSKVYKEVRVPPETSNYVCKDCGHTWLVAK